MIHTETLFFRYMNVREKIAAQVSEVRDSDMLNLFRSCSLALTKLLNNTTNRLYRAGLKMKGKIVNIPIIISDCLDKGVVCEG